ncbi:MAG: hypothetical protein M5U26_13930 [Planctomycetota bacterium]|nr:hypothetical protein [Planctomycetota bacterium]
MRGLSIIAVMLLCGLSFTRCQAAEGEELLKQLEPTVDKMLKAYNDEDHKTFNAEYAKMMAAVATEQTFKNIFINMYKKDFGNYASKELIKDQTVLQGEMPLLVFQCKFEKNEKVKVSVNFTTEEGALKVMQIRFDKM